jgi:hypothetical protein
MMVIRSDNITVNKLIVEECISELERNVVKDKKEYYNDIIYNRLIIYNSLCNKRYDDNLDRLLNLVMNNYNLRNFKTIIKDVNKLSTYLLDNQIKLYNVLEDYYG